MPTDDRPPHAEDPTLDPDGSSSRAETTPDAALADSLRSLIAPHPARFGGYAILGILGEGGMGLVYRARQERPRRDVALKVIRPGAVNDRLRRRFEQEVEVLGRLAHPGIAQVFEAGVDDATGSPYFAMELVEGPTLVEYARTHRLGTRDRLRLLAKVCHAVQHAHQKGVIHRDLKPSNILVTEIERPDGRVEPQPKILDFGVARATNADVRTATLQTDVGQLVGTVPYMSPEQVTGDPTQLDVRSDVYALGVVLFELLAGRLPYDLGDRMVHEAARIIREDDPTRLSAVDVRLRGDVETIVGKALEKDKERRYQSAVDLASDIERHLDDQPIAARPPSGWYQFRKFARRNRALVGGAAATVVALVAGIVGTTTYALQASDQRDDAVHARREESEARRVATERAREAEAASARAIAAERATRHELDRANEVKRIVVEMISGASPFVARGEDITIMRSLVDGVAARLESGRVENARIAAELHGVVASVYFHLALYEESERHAVRALRLCEALLGAEARETIDARRMLGNVQQVRGRLDEAERNLTIGLDAARRRYGPDDPITATAMFALGTTLMVAQRPAEAESLLSEAWARFRDLHGESSLLALAAMDNLAQTLGPLHRETEANALFERLYELRTAALGPDHPDTISALNSLATVRRDTGRTREAETLLRDAIERGRRILGDDHPLTLLASRSLAEILGRRGAVDEAAALLEDVRERQRRVLGPDHLETLTTLMELAELHLQEGRVEDATREASELLERSASDDDPARANLHRTALAQLSQAHLRAGRMLDATDACLRYLAERAERVDGQTRVVLEHLNLIGSVLTDDGRLEEALDAYALALAHRRAILGDEDRDTLGSITNLGLGYARLERYVEAAALLEESCAGKRRRLDADDPWTEIACDALAQLYTLLGRTDDAQAVRSGELPAAPGPLDAGSP